MIVVQTMTAPRLYRSLYFTAPASHGPGLQDRRGATATSKPYRIGNVLRTVPASLLLIVQPLRAPGPSTQALPSPAYTPTPLEIQPPERCPGRAGGGPAPEAVL